MKVKVWDIPTRLFHWSLVTAFAGAFFTSGTEWFLEYHTVFGYIALGLALFRVFWGFAGNRYARFSDFAGGWRRVRDYLRQAATLKPPRYLGHNPAVGWVVLFMLLMTLSLVATGVITYGGEEGRGLWAGLVTRDTGIFFREIHDFLADLAVAVIVIHVSAARQGLASGESSKSGQGRTKTAADSLRAIIEAFRRGRQVFLIVSVSLEGTRRVLGEALKMRRRPLTRSPSGPFTQRPGKEYGTAEMIVGGAVQFELDGARGHLRKRRCAYAVALFSKSQVRTFVLHGASSLMLFRSKKAQ